MTEFYSRQRDYFRRLLEEKWACDEPHHTICVFTEDKQEFCLEERHIERWIDGLCNGTCSTASPPKGMFEDIRHGAVINQYNGHMSVTAVEVSPSRQRASMASASRYTESRGKSSRASTYSYTSSTSYALGPGYNVARGLTRLGRVVGRIIDDTIISKRGRSHLDLLKKWRSRRDPNVGINEENKVLEILEDALYMSIPSASLNLRKLSFEIGKSVQSWLQALETVHLTRRSILLLVQVQTCLVPLILRRVVRHEPRVADLAWNLTEDLMKIPLGINDISLISAEEQRSEDAEDTPKIAIVRISEELAYAKCPSQHGWLGIHLLRIVELTLQLRPLTLREEQAILELAHRRIQNEKIITKIEELRPWEVALFALCAKQNLAFREHVMAITGVPALLSTLEGMLPPSVQPDNVRWDDIVIIIRSLAFVSGQDWLAQSDLMVEQIIKLLVTILRLNIPLHWFPVHYWATDTLRNLIAHRPVSASILLRYNLQTPIKFVSHPELPSPAISSVGSSSDVSYTTQSLKRQESSVGNESYGHSRRYSSSSSAPSLDRAPSRLDSYLDEASKRAEELANQVKEWTKYTPDSLPKIQPVDATELLRATLMLDKIVRDDSLDAV